MIMGTPSKYSYKYRSQKSKDAHFYEYTPSELKSVCEERFKRVFMFSMNDEIVHTGFDKLAWFFFLVCVK